MDGYAINEVTGSETNASVTFAAGTGKNYSIPNISSDTSIAWNEGNVTYKIWLENASSTEERLKLVSQYSLAGASFWKLGFESSDVWDTVIKYIN